MPSLTPIKEIAIEQEGYDEAVTAVRYNNNSIHELTDLNPTIASLVVNPAAVSWLDFSFNDIANLDDVRYLLAGRYLVKL